MNLRTLMQAGPAKANDLFARIAETSDGAVKTREKLFTELKAELELYTSLEEQHLFPILRRNTETKELVADAIKDNKALRAKLVELEVLPKNDEAFLEGLKELQKAFRQHARDDKRELLPAVQRALSEEQVQSVVDKIEAGVAEAEQSKQEEAEERRAKARQEREQAEFVARQTELRIQQAETTEREQVADARRLADTALAPVVATATAAGEVTHLAAAALGADARRRAQASALSTMFLWPWIGAMQNLQQVEDAASVRGPSGTEEVIPLGEEVLEIGKRTENRGTARIHRFVVETPIERQITLQSEKVVVERRRPVSDKISGEILTEVTVEVVETEEVPTIAKRMRVREEIIVRTERSQRVQTVKETVRRDEVEIEQTGRKLGKRQLGAATVERAGRSS